MSKWNTNLILCFLSPVYCLLSAFFLVQIGSEDTRNERNERNDIRGEDSDLNTSTTATERTHQRGHENVFLTESLREYMTA